MKSTKSMKTIALLAGAVLLATTAGAETLDHTIPPGNNFDKAEFRLWYPDGAGPFRAVLVLVPGSNGDGRPMAQEAFWQELATRNKLAIVACRFTDKPHEQSSTTSSPRGSPSASSRSSSTRAASTTRR